MIDEGSHNTPSIHMQIVDNEPKDEMYRIGPEIPTLKAL